jgi:hypothetical protein
MTSPSAIVLNLYLRRENSLETTKRFRQRRYICESLQRRRLDSRVLRIDSFGHHWFNGCVCLRRRMGSFTKKDRQLWQCDIETSNSQCKNSHPTDDKSNGLSHDLSVSFSSKQLLGLVDSIRRVVRSRLEATLPLANLRVKKAPSKCNWHTLHPPMPSRLIARVISNYRFLSI